MKQRRSDGKFGHDPSIAEPIAKRGRPFEIGHKLSPGRRRGSKNKIKSEMAALMAQRPGYGEGEEIPDDDLEALQWIKKHPRASLELRNDATKARAKFFHRTLRDDHVTLGLEPGVLRAKAAEGRERVAREKRERDARDKDSKK